MLQYLFLIGGQKLASNVNQSTLLFHGFYSYAFVFASVNIKEYPFINTWNILTCDLLVRLRIEVVLKKSTWRSLPVSSFVYQTCFNVPLKNSGSE